ncbi:hypothetical protein TNCT_289421 [Trichonephila clavata]|uniref:Uncharacterized protein n=1 Tax=Trichonephila clavata TaxID=2740835 RepID=A0A8X6HFK1_TRICU|nr:hypothetical protein TNCT_289421 [Trichonephila clavata]
MVKKFESTGSLASRQRSGRPSTATAVSTTVEKTMQSMSVVAAHGECRAQEVLRQTGVSRFCEFGIITEGCHPLKCVCCNARNPVNGVMTRLTSVHLNDGQHFEHLL